MDTKNNSLENIDLDFDLPVDEDAPKAKPRIHVAPGDSACTSCEG